MSTAIKVYDESMPGAPVLGSGAGTELAVLYACLCTGFGQRSATITVAGGVATVTTANEPKNANMLHTVILVEGVTGALSALNGEQKITATTATTLQFATSEADGTAAGTITIKTAPAGWQRVFNDDTNHVSVFKSNDPQSTGKYLRVDGSNTQYTYVRGYSNMTDVNTGTAPFPPATVADNAFKWVKGVNGSGQEWELFADTRAFYYAPACIAGSSRAKRPYFFGDLINDSTTDGHGCVLTSLGSGLYVHAYSLANIEEISRQHHAYIAKAMSGMGDGVRVYIYPIGGQSGYSGADAFLGVFPTAGGRVLLSKMAVINVTFRGVLPGIYYVPQVLRNSGLTGRCIELDNNGKLVRAINTQTGYSSAEDQTNQYQKMFIQVTGSWR